MHSTQEHDDLRRFCALGERLPQVSRRHTRIDPTGVGNETSEALHRKVGGKLHPSNESVDLFGTATGLAGVETGRVTIAYMAESWAFHGPSIASPLVAES